ncbi:MAG: ABC transporter permease [Acidobacteriia bacterium]|nr:ABC transporter permease [Terriglobia bacterium]
MGKGFLQDFGYAFRRLVAYRLSTLSVVLVLGLGIGAATAIFSLVSGVLLHPLPIEQIDRVVVLTGAATPPGQDRMQWWSRVPSFDAFAQYISGDGVLTRKDDLRSVSIAAVSSRFFDVFRVRCSLGRQFTPDDEASGRGMVAVLSHSLWLSDFGRDNGIIGQNILVNGNLYAVVGVMSPSFVYPGRTDIWIPRLSRESQMLIGVDSQSAVPLELRGQVLVGRLRRDGMLDQARSETQALFDQLKHDFGSTGVFFGSGVRVTPLREMLVRNFRPAVWTLFVSAAFLLLIASVNSAIILLAQTAGRQREVAIRRSLGASRQQIMRLIFTEAFSLTILGGGLGVLISYWGIAVVRKAAPFEIPGLLNAHIDRTVLLFALGVSVFTALMVGAAAAIHAASFDPTHSLGKEISRSRGVISRGLQRVFVALQVSLTMTLLTGAALVAQSFLKLTAVNPGFDPRDVLTAKMTLSNRILNGPEKVALLHEELLERVHKLPGVSAVGSVDDVPMGGATGGNQWFETIEKAPTGMARTITVGGDYFQAMGIPVLKGRSFRTGDTGYSSAVAIIGESLARRFGGERYPIGESLRVGGERGFREIVGVVGDVKFFALGEDPEAQIYLPITQAYHGQPPRNFTLVVRGPLDMRSLMRVIQGGVGTRDRDVVLLSVSKLEALVSGSIGSVRFRGFFFALFAAIALLLALLGVYGVVAYSVACRTHEFGVRISLGAQRHQILMMVLGEGGKLVVWGVMAGTLISIGLSRFMASLLFGVGATDGMTFLGAALFIVIATLVACMIPAERACRVEPIEVLRYE